jgi:hypothetical protein
MPLGATGPSSPRHERYFALAVSLAYLLAATAAALVHEPWRDEAQAWLIARDAASPLQLLQNLRYEGHPGLWHLVLWPLTRIGWIGLMQVLAVAIGAISAYLFARFAPFPRLARALFGFGYLQLWEWGALARNYGLGVLLLLCAAALAVRRERHAVALGLALALAANTSLHAAIVAGGLLALLLFERASPWRDPSHAAPPGPFWTGVSLASAGIAACALQIAPPVDSAVAFIWQARTFGDRLGMALASPVHGLASLPWGPPLERYAVIDRLHVATGVLVALMLAVTALLALSRRRGAWVAAAVPWATLVALFFFRYYGGPRHAGFLLVALLVALWLAPSFPPRRREGRFASAAAWGESRLGTILAGAFLFQITGAAIQAYLDGSEVYSGARAAAALIRSHGLTDLTMVADPDSSTSNVLAHLGKRQAFYENVERWGSFAIWDSRHAPGRPGADRAADQAVFARARTFAQRDPVVVVLDREPNLPAVTSAQATLIGARTSNLRRDESFWVYLVPAAPE